jgi:hypothetical protein
MQGNFAATLIVALLFRLFEVDFHMGAVAVVTGNIAVQPADLLFYMSPKPRINLRMYPLDLKSL